MPPEKRIPATQDQLQSILNEEQQPQPQGAVNPYDQAAAQLAQQSASLRQSVAYGATQNPEDYAKLLQLQKQTGVAPHMAQSYRQPLEQSADVNSIDYPQFAVSHPRTAAWASNPDNAAVAGVSEIQRLASIEANAGEMRANTWWQGFQANTIQPAFRALMGYPLTRMGIDVVGGSAGMLGNIGSRFGVHGDGATNQNLLQRIQSGLDVSQTGGYINGAPDKDNGVDWLAKNVGPMVPALLASGGVSLLARTLGLSTTTAKVLAGLSVGGMFSADQSGKTYTSEKAAGASDDDALRAANQVLAINAIPNALFGATDVVPFLRDNPFLTSLGLGGATGVSGQVGQNWITGKPLSSGVLSSALQGMAMQGGMHLGTEAFFGNLAGAIDATEQSKLRQIAPDKFHEALQDVFAGDASLQIPADRFNDYFKSKGMDPGKVARALGSTNYAEAVMAGNHVDIPKEDFLGKLDPEHQAGLFPDIVDPVSGLTLRQHQEGRDELEKFATGGGAEKLIQDTAAADAETAASPEYLAVKEQLRQRYTDAGETPEVAETLATKDANAYSNLARNAGMKPTELLNLYNPKVTLGEATGMDAPGAVKVQSGPGETLFQSGKPVSGVDGKESTLLTPNGKLPATYRLVEAADLVPSHNPETFAVNKDYPEGVQERAYDKSKEAQARVIEQAQNYEPAYTVNTNPDAVNGPPVITPDGTVLGGNSRTMSTVRLYREGNGDVYRNALREQAGEYGLKPEDVDGMKEPVLVRQVAAPESADAMRRLGSDLNRSMTGALGAAEKAVSVGKNIKPETLRWVSDELNAGDLTLREMLSSRGSDVLKRLVEDGALTDRERPQYIDAATGGLNEAGKSFVEKALLGTVIDDPRLMESAPKSIIAKIERSLGAITSFASRPDEWNILPALREAIGEHGAIQRSGSSVELRLGQTSMFGEARNPVVDALVRTLDEKPTAVKKAFDDYARDSDANPPGQSRMFGSAEPFDAFNHAFGSTLSAEDFYDGTDNARTAGTEPGSKTESAPGDGRLSEASAGDSGTGSTEPAGATHANEIDDAWHELGSIPDHPYTHQEPAEPESPRGWFRVLPDGSYEIGRTKIGDLSTFVHEPGHAYLKIIGDLAKRDGASDILKDDYRKILDFLGAKDGEPFTREQQETWARANEQYLREGDAPSTGLKGVFQRFAIWLHSVYQKASDLGVELTPEIRGVMDRLYASEEGVNRAETEAGPRLFNSPEEAGWTDEQFKSYADDKGIGVDQAKAEILARLNEAALRDKTDSWRNEENNVRQALTAEVDQRPEYSAIRALRKGELDDGTELTMSRDDLVRQFGEDRVKALQKQHPGLYRNDGGVDAETAAEALGFTSASEMMKALEAAPRRSEAIDNATRDYMTEKHGDIRYDGTLNDQARIALENDKKSDSLYRELRALRKKVADMQAQSAGRKEAMKAIDIAPMDSYREAAHLMVESKGIADLQPNRYLDASRKYSREAFDALRKGDAQAAAEAKHKELMNHFLFREATTAKEYVGKFESYAKRMQTSGPQGKLGLAGGDYRDQFNYLMGRYNIGRPAAAVPERPLTEWALALHAEGKEPAIDPVILNEKPNQNYRTVPISELRKVHDALINIRKLADQELGIEVNGKKIEFAKAVSDMAERAKQSLTVKPTRVLTGNATVGERLTNFAQRGDALLMRAERIMEWLDGGKEGPWHDNLWHLAADAQGDEYALQEAVTKRIGDALEQMPKEQRMRMLDKVDIDGIPETVTRHDLVSMALNMGNQGNLERLEKTFQAHGWDTSDSLWKIQGSLTREEWQFVQDTWDSLKPLGDRMVELEERLTGLPPIMVKPTPLSVKLADGTEMHLSGGYYPVAMDPRFSTRGALQDSDSTQNLMEAGYGRATTSRGYTKARTGFGGPLLLDYEQVLTQHTAKVIKDISHREFMLVANKLLLDPTVRQTLRETLGAGHEEQMMPWLRTIINDRNGSAAQGLGDFSRTMRAMRTNLTLASLTYKVSTSLLQWTHAPRMLLLTKPGSYAQAMVDFMAHPKDVTAEVQALSPNEMRFRGQNLDRDLRSTMQDQIGKTGLYKAAVSAGSLSMMYTDHVLSFPLWLSVYRDALTEHVDLSEDQAKYKAMQAADSAVRLGLGSGSPKDLPPIMRNNDMSKFLTMFYSFHNGIYGQVRDIAHQTNSMRDVPKMTYGLALSVLVPAVLSKLVLGQGPKDGENWGLWAAKRSLLFGMDTMPLVRDVASALDSDGDVKFNPLMNVFSKGAKAGMQAMSDKADKDWKGIGLNTLETAMDLTGVPGTTQAMKPLHYLDRVSQGKVENPNAWDAVVGSPRR